MRGTERRPDRQARRARRAERSRRTRPTSSRTRSRASSRTARAPRRYFGRPAAGKTGTAENFKDAWFCGYVPQLATCVWIGYPKAEISLYDVEGVGAVVRRLAARDDLEPLHVGGRAASCRSRTSSTRSSRATPSPRRTRYVPTYTPSAPTPTTTDSGAGAARAGAEARCRARHRRADAAARADADPATRARAAAPPTDDRAATGSSLDGGALQRSTASTISSVRRSSAPSARTTGAGFAARPRARDRPARRAAGPTRVRSRRGRAAASSCSSTAPRALPRIARRRSRAARVARPPRRLALRRPSFRLGRRTGRRCASCWPRRPSGSTCACSPGRARRCRSSTRPRRGARRCATSSSRGTRIAMALDARERPMHCHHEKLVVVDDRVAFVGGIDLTALGGRPARLERPSARATGSAGTTRAVRLEGPIVADVARALPRSAGTGRRRYRRRRAAGGGRAASRRSSCARCPSGVYDGLPRRRVLDPRELPARAAVGRAVRLSREPVPLVARARLRCSPRSCAGRRATTSAWSSLLPAQPNNGADDTRGQLGVLVDADEGRRRRRRASSPARSSSPGRRQPGVRAREGRRSSTTAGSRSARRTSTSTRSSTTPR